MPGNDSFELVSERAWRRGFDNMLRSGLARWFKTRSWWVNCLIWGGIVAAILASLLFYRPPPPLDVLVMIALIFIGLFPAVGVVIIMQDAIIGEKAEGTAAWLLSKPLTRSAFVLSKMVSNSIGVMLTMTIVPSVIAFAIIELTHKSALAPLGILGAMGVLFVNHFFFLTLTLMLGTFFSGRGAVIGIPLALLFFQQNLLGRFPALRFILPWNLIASLGESNPLAQILILGLPVPTELLITLLLVIVESILFASIAVWRFNREEF